MKKNILISAFCILLFSCSSEEESPIIDTETTGQTPTDGNENESGGREENGEINDDFTYFQLADNNQLDFTRINILSEEKNSEVLSDGSFEDLDTSNYIDFNLVLYDNEAMLAYYPSLIVSNKIDIANFLVFYFANIPLISLYDLDKEDLYELILGNSYKTQLYEEFQTSLNSGKNPLGNSSFVQLLNKAANSIKLEIDNNSQNRGQIGDYSLTYNRDGVISIPSISPIGTVLGIEISNDNGSIFQDGVYLVKPKLPLALEFFLKEINYLDLFPDSDPKK